MGEHHPLIVVGAGIGGLALSAGLMRLGRKVLILEAAPELSEVGAGISLAPNAAKAIDYLGLLDAVANVSDVPEYTSIAHYRTGEELTTAPLGQELAEHFGAAYYQLHRSDLQAILLNAVQALDPAAIHLGHQVTSIEQNDEHVHLACSNGKTFSASHVIACDGIRSSVRNALIKREDPRFTGQVAYRATMPVTDEVRSLLTGAPSMVTVGPQRFFTQYTVRHGKLFNLVAVVQADEWRQEGWSNPATNAELLAEFADWNENVRGLIGLIPDDALFKWALFDREPLSDWISGRVALLGDAAHPMLPFLGMGAAMALEDAVVLVRAVEASPDMAEAFRRYETARRERANSTLLASRKESQYLQHSDPDAVAWDKQDTDKTAQWTRFAYDPVSTPI